MKKITAMAAVLAMAAVTQAATVTTTGAGWVKYSDTASGSVDNPINVTVQQFNNISGTYAGATLNSVTLSLVDTTASADVTVNNTGSSSRDITVTFSGGLRFGNGAKNVTDNLTLAETIYTVGAKSSYGPVALTTDAATANHSFNSASGLSAFIGTGDIASMAISLVGSWGGYGWTSGGVESGNNKMTGTWSVRYDYSEAPGPVPEPASMALLGIGGLVVALRRRFSKKA